MLLRSSRLMQRVWVQHSRTCTTITAAMVKDLRDRSGAPMLECKKALAAEKGDVSKAMDWLRAKGIAKAAANSTRVAVEGVIGVYAVDNRLSLIEVNSETDFVSRNTDFQQFVTSALRTAHSIPATVLNPETLLDAPLGSSTLRAALGDLTLKIRENIVLRRVSSITAAPGSILATYVHNKLDSSDDIQLGKEAAVIELSAQPALSDIEPLTSAGKKLAMHVVAAKPEYLSANDVPADIVAKEEQTLASKAKPEMVDKIVSNKVAKRLSEISLLGQLHMVEDGNPVISKYLEALSKTTGSRVNIPQYKYWSLGQTVSATEAKDE